jgi:hypothetical protein
VAKTAEQRAQAAFRDAQARWRGALEAHRLAPPDAEFSARLAALASAAQVEADACRAAEAAGFEWPPHRASSSKPPYELQPGSVSMVIQKCRWMIIEKCRSASSASAGGARAEAGACTSLCGAF